eukprot:Skav220669  [mRNA]  locus=scaffold1914:141517:143106:+ [translate_table: standard]
MASSVAGNESWLRDEVEVSRSRRCLQSLKDWWGETTDIVILNSPLMNRAAGNVFRCITMPCLLVLFVFHDYYYHLDFSLGSIVASTAVLLTGSLASFLAILWRVRESVRASWFYCFVIAAGNAFISSKLHPGIGMWSTEEDQCLCILAVLRHCNIHPIPLLLLMVSMLGLLFLNAEAGFFGPFAEMHRAWCGCILPVMFCAYTQDFTVRVKAISTGMILPPGGRDPGETGAPHESPLSGRSARRLCWLLILITWIAWVALMIGKASYKEGIVGSYYEDLFENRLPICAWLVPCVLSASILVWVSSKSACSAPWLADLILLICSCTPAALIFADLVPVLYVLGVKPELVRLEFAAESQRWVRSMLFVSQQVLVQAGCHPILCICPFALLPVHAAVCFHISSSHGDIKITALPSQGMDYFLVVSWIIWIASTIDYINRYRAIREALQRAQQNAASTQTLLDSIINPINPSGSGLELQPLTPMDPAEPPVMSSDPVAVAVVRHAERADAAHTLDDWGGSEVGVLGGLGSPPA